MKSFARHLSLALSLSAAFAIAVACGGGDDSKSTAPSSAPQTTAAKESASAPSVQELSAEAKRCLDLVRSKQYVAAIDPCEKAAKDTASKDVQQAYDEAKAEVQKEAQRAAATAAAESLEGKPVDQAGKDAANSALKSLGGGAAIP